MRAELPGPAATLGTYAIGEVQPDTPARRSGSGLTPAPLHKLSGNRMETAAAAAVASVAAVAGGSGIGFGSSGDSRLEQGSGGGCGGTSVTVHNNWAFLRALRGPNVSTAARHGVTGQGLGSAPRVGSCALK